jgi:hypothetical protein
MGLLIQGNKKMGKKVFLYNLPAKETCTPTSWCLEGKNGKPSCYALRNNFNLPSVVKASQNRLKASKRDDFVDKMVSEIHTRKPKFFRIHSGGDFYSEEYIKKWKEIVQQCPDTLFRTTTRRRDFAKSIEELASEPNIIIRESLDLEVPYPTMNLPFAAISYLPIVKESKSYHCPNDCEKCRYTCWKTPCNMNFDEH